MCSTIECNSINGSEMLKLLLTSPSILGNFARVLIYAQTIFT